MHPSRTSNNLALKIIVAVVDTDVAPNLSVVLQMSIIQTKQKTAYSKFSSTGGGWGGGVQGEPSQSVNIKTNIA